MITALTIAAALLLLLWAIVAASRSAVARRAPEVYIAAPFAPRCGLSSRENTDRAMALRRVYVARGKATCCVHPLILSGRLGDDTDPKQRAQGMRRTLRICAGVARRGGILAVLRAPDGTLSSGTAAELARFERARGRHLDARVEFWTWDDVNNRPVREQ